MRVKNINHKIYEKTEGKDGIKRSKQEIDKLFKEMVVNASTVPDPRGIKEFYPPEWAKRKNNVYS